MSEQSLRPLTISNFQNPVTDVGSEANNAVTFWQPSYTQPTSGTIYCWLGTVAVGNYNPEPVATTYVVADIGESPGDDPLLAAPTGFIELWTCIGNDQSSNLGIYGLMAPDGYVGLGIIAVTDFNSPPQITDPQYQYLRCVRQDWCSQVSNSNSIWTDQGSGAPTDVSVWGLQNSAIAFGTVSQTQYPASANVWDLAQPLS